MTIRGIARDAGVALQTVRNHFASKDDLLHGVLERLDAEIRSVRFAVDPGDVDTAVTTLVDDYERNGDANLRMLAVEPRVPAVQPFMDHGRASHQDWVERVFPAGARRACAARPANAASPSWWSSPTSTPGSCFAVTRDWIAIRRSRRCASWCSRCTTTNMEVAT